QAGEQIIFRQDGDMVTAVVLIQYVGNAADFSWVVPAPGIPEVTVGSDLVFAPLELATRPQFNLTRLGSQCVEPFGGIAGAPATGNANRSANAANANGGVQVLEQFAVGPYDIQIVASDDPQALVTWLDENNYALTDRGRELIATYVREECNFVAVKLQQDRGTGDIQPLIMRYQKQTPVIPIRLTAVAAQNDMGVLVWLLGNARAVPTNYLHVEVNYTLLNWYSSPSAAYASYQGLVTLAMNEAGGQGFATDYAGDDLDLTRSLPDPIRYRRELTRLSGLLDGAFYGQLYADAVFGRMKVLDILHRELPLPAGAGDFTYSSFDLLLQVFDAAMLSAARQRISADLVSDVIEPLERTLDVFNGMPYLTRLYTTLSADEMTLDPAFVFNPDLPGQALRREATLTLSCVDGQTHWQLTLGAGTGRDGETVIRGFGSPPFSTPTINQPAVARSARTRSSGPPEYMTVNVPFAVVTIGTPQSNSSPVRRLCGLGWVEAALFSLLSLGVTSLAWRRRASRQP
ncbi:MAG TPA: DUF2330 domain-containing protein, partial [Phycisphaerae bacterium]